MVYSIEDFDFRLPPEQVAAEPLEERSASRMMVVDRDRRTFDDAAFDRLPEFLRPGDLLAVNNTKVFPARLYGRMETGAKIEIFLIEDAGRGRWKCLARPARRLSAGKRLIFGRDLSAETVERNEDGTVELRFDVAGEELHAAIDALGRTPLPPYIKRDPDALDRDRERYQTVFAKERGAIAAPTAGLHFTPDVLDRIRERGVEVYEITLHVGYGTFEPVRVAEISQHRVAGEHFAIGEETASRLNAALRDGSRVVAVGTTTTRTLEYVAHSTGEFRAGRGIADLTIVPGHRFDAVGAMLTNFHLPKSSLLILVSAFAGRELIMDAYEHAVDSGYRFYSYGDCMLIL